jgi:pimeloyl-ACP methyl ester carboxylesterase
MKRMFADTPEGQIYYRTEGDGAPVLFMHKASLSSEEFTELLPSVGKKYRAIAVDVLGCGNSDQPNFKPQIEDYARNVIHFLDALKIEKTNIVGRLFGASIAVEIAAVYPERVNKLVLCDCLYVEPEVLKKAEQEYRNETVVFKEDGSHLINVWNGRRAKPPVKLEMAQRATIEYLKSDLGRRAGDSHHAKFVYDVGPRLSKIKSPVLLLYSDRSGLYPRAEAVKKLIPSCTAKLITGTPSFPTWEKPAEYAAAILDFLQNPDTDNTMSK